MRRLLRGRMKFKRGAFRNVYLHSVIEGRSTKTGTEAVKEELGRAGLGVELAKATTKKLLKLVSGLRTPHHDSNWSQYRETCSYSDADRAAKERFVRYIVTGNKPNVVWDLGCNDGAFARIAAEHASLVVAADSDPVVVDGLYRSLRDDGPANVLPLVMNLLDPSPARGWRGRERRAFDDRGRPDLVLALALVHHLALAGNVPLVEIVDWLASLSDTVVVEFVDRHDPMAERLLANKPRGTHDDYERAGFEAALEAKFEVTRREELPSGSRVLYAREGARCDNTRQPGVDTLGYPYDYADMHGHDRSRSSGRRPPGHQGQTARPERGRRRASCRLARVARRPGARPHAVRARAGGRAVRGRHGARARHHRRRVELRAPDAPDGRARTDPQGGEGRALPTGRPISRSRCSSTASWSCCT